MVEYKPRVSIVYWTHELGHTWLGDSDLNGEFNSGDLIHVLAAGEYEDDVALNSVWSEGDWSGDGDFTSSDLILGLQDGGYERGPRQMAVGVPEAAIGLGQAIMGLLVFALGHGRSRMK